MHDIVSFIKNISCEIDTYCMVDDLSASEMQMIEIAKALSFQSKLIIMDEPSSSLTSEELKKLGILIKDLRAKGISIIYISHKLDEIFEYCDIVTIMRDGKVIDTKKIEELTRSEMIAKMVGRDMESEYPPLPDSVGDVLLEVKNLNTNKLHDIDLTLHKGEILGLVGLVGAGRTEIIRALYGADRVKSKEVYLNGEKVVIHSPKDAKKHGMGLVPEDRKQQGLVLRFSVERNLTMAAFDRLTKFGFLNMVKYMSIWLFDVYMLLNIDCIVLSGGLLAMGDKLIKKVEEQFRRYQTTEFDVQFYQTELGTDSGLTGAVELLF